MRLPDKRELASMYVLYMEGPELNYGTALDIIANSLCCNKKTARNIVKRLRKLGALKVYKRGGELLVRVEDPAAYLERVIRSYVSMRSSRCPRRPMTKAVLSDQ